MKTRNFRREGEGGSVSNIVPNSELVQ